MSGVEARPVAEPVLRRPVTLTFQGDWGQANLHRVCGWLCQEIGDRAPAGSRFGIWSGRGGTDAVAALLAGQVDIALLTPTAAVRMVAHRVGPLALPGSDRLRSLGTIAQRDRLVVCVDAELGIHRLGELAEVVDRLRIATSPDDGVNLIGLAAHRLLSVAGLAPQALLDAGGTFQYSERPFPALAAFRSGEANVLIHEAIMTPGWQRVAERGPVRYLDVDELAAAAFAEWHWPTAVVADGYLPTLDRDLTSLEFSDFAVLCTEELPDDVAELVAWCLVTTRHALEVQYHHLDPAHSPVTYPLEPEAIASGPVELHPAAARGYASLPADAVATGPAIWE